MRPCVLFAAVLVVGGCGNPVGDDGGAPPTDAPHTDAPSAHPDVATLTEASVPDANDLDVAQPQDAATDAARADAAPDAGPPAVRWVGRIDHGDPAGARFEWSGTTLYARFSGTSIGVTLNGGVNYFNVSIDGTAHPTLTTMSGSHTYPLASGLAAGAHELRLYRRNEAFGGAVQYLGLAFASGGALLPPSPAPARRIEVVGDSISCGYGDEGAGPSCHFDPAQENHDITYGAITARNLSAELITTAWSGKGMYRNNDNTTTDTMPTLYNRTLPTDASSAWSFASWTPDVVVINLGTNDFAPGDPGTPYVTAYTTFVTAVRAHYPHAYIIATVGPMLGGTSATACRGYVDRVVAARHTAGDTNIEALTFPTQTAASGFGCDYHPSPTTHMMMATQLTAEIRRVMSW